MTKIKICGLSRPCDAEYAVRLGLDYAGFIVNVPQSRRSVGFDRLRELCGLIREPVQKVGVFVNEKQENIAAVADCLDLVQLHGNEDNAYIERLKKKMSLPVIQAIAMRSESDAEKARQSIADFVLLDAKTAGSGQCFDWNLVPLLSKPFFLAGGLMLGNLEEAVQKVRPYAVDISSGAEIDGFKDFGTMQKLVHCVRSADNE